MFLKILKWDLKSQRKIFILFLLYGLSLVNLVLLKMLDVDWLIGIAIAFHTILAMLVVTAPLILLAINYYTDFYGKNAYTMHQLATKTSTILNAKILSGVIYTLLSVVLLFFGTLAANAIFNGYTSSAEVLEAFSKAFGAFAEFPNYIENISAPGFWLIIILLGALALFSAQIYYAIIVTFGSGKLLGKLGKGGVVISFLIVYFGGQMLSFLNVFYMPLSAVVESGTAGFVRLTITARTMMSLIEDPEIGQLIPIPLGPLLMTIIFAVFGYIYVAYALNNSKNVV